MLKVRRSGLRPENLAVNGIRELKERKKEREIAIIIQCMCERDRESHTKRVQSKGQYVAKIESKRSQKNIFYVFGPILIEAHPHPDVICCRK